MAHRVLDPIGTVFVFSRSQIFGPYTGILYVTLKRERSLGKMELYAVMVACVVAPSMLVSRCNLLYYEHSVGADRVPLGYYRGGGHTVIGTKRGA